MPEKEYIEREAIIILTRSHLQDLTQDFTYKILRLHGLQNLILNDIIGSITS